MGGGMLVTTVGRSSKNMIIKYSTCIALVSVFVCGSIKGSDEDISRGIKLLSLQEVAFRDGNEKQFQREVLVERLLSILRSPAKTRRFYDPTTERNIAIAMVGLMKASEAIPELLETQTPWFDSHYNSISDKYRLYSLSPASTALYAIGAQSVAPILAQLKKAGPVLNGYESLKVLVALEGFDKVVRLLEQESDVCRENDSKERLLESVKVLKKDEKLMRTFTSPAVPTVVGTAERSEADSKSSELFGEDNAKIVAKGLLRIASFGTWQEAEQVVFVEGLIGVDSVSNATLGFLAQGCTNTFYSAVLRQKMLLALVSHKNDSTDAMQSLEKIALDPNQPVAWRIGCIELTARSSVGPKEARCIQELLSRVAKNDDGGVGREAAICLAVRWKLKLIDLTYKTELLRAGLRRHTSSKSNQGAESEISEMLRMLASENPIGRKELTKKNVE
jgi:hypothetical protein